MKTEISTKFTIFEGDFQDGSCGRTNQKEYTVQNTGGSNAHNIIFKDLAFVWSDWLVVYSCVFIKEQILSQRYCSHGKLLTAKFRSKRMCAKHFGEVCLLKEGAWECLVVIDV